MHQGIWLQREGPRGHTTRGLIHSVSNKSITMAAGVTPDEATVTVYIHRLIPEHRGNKYKYLKSFWFILQDKQTETTHLNTKHHQKKKWVKHFKWIWWYVCFTPNIVKTTNWTYTLIQNPVLLFVYPASLHPSHLSPNGSISLSLGPHPTPPFWGNYLMIILSHKVCKLAFLSARPCFPLLIALFYQHSHSLSLSPLFSLSGDWGLIS